MNKAPRYIKKLVLFLLFVSILLFIFSYFRKNNLPPIEVILNSLSQEPEQVEITMDPFEVQRSKYTYTITPKYSYEIYGLVVADYDSENWIDISHENDPLNTKDVCVVWGDNVKSDIYQKMKYSHGEWTCYYEADNSADFNMFSPYQLSNNHLLPSNDNIHKEIKNSSVGDQIYFKGYLVNYQIESSEGQTTTRDTSTTREDTGCEVIYVTDFQILHKANKVFHQIHSISKYLILILTVLFLILFFIG